MEAANNREAVLIFTLTYSGTSARLLAKFRPRCPIVVLTKNASAGAACNLHRGVMPYLCPLEDADFSVEGEVTLTLTLTLTVTTTSRARSPSPSP